MLKTYSFTMIVVILLNKNLMDALDAILTTAIVVRSLSLMLLKILEVKRDEH